MPACGCLWPTVPPDVVCSGFPASHPSRSLTRVNEGIRFVPRRGTRRATRSGVPVMWCRRGASTPEWSLPVGRASRRLSLSDCLLRIAGRTSDHDSSHHSGMLILTFLVGVGQYTHEYGRKTSTVMTVNTASIKIIRHELVLPRARKVAITCQVAAGPSPRQSCLLVDSPRPESTNDVCAGAPDGAGPAASAGMNWRASPDMKRNSAASRHAPPQPVPRAQPAGPRAWPLRKCAAVHCPVADGVAPVRSSGTGRPAARPWTGSGARAPYRLPRSARRDDVPQGGCRSRAGERRLIASHV